MDLLRAMDFACLEKVRDRGRARSELGLAVACKTRVVPGIPVHG
jgi:hypothetical protein